MIVFNNWQITISGVLAQQYDNLTRKVEVVGELPDGYEWSLLVECGENKDTLHLERTAAGAEVVLTQDNLSVSGYYKLQLRGNLAEDTSKTRHTNVVQTYIPASLSGVGQWPQMPSEFAQIEQRLLELNAHPPIPGENGYWMIWNPATDQYEGSTFETETEAAALRAEAAENAAASHEAAAAKSAESAAKEAATAAQEKTAAASERQAAETAKAGAETAKGAAESAASAAAGSANGAAENSASAADSATAAAISAKNAAASALGAAGSEKTAKASETAAAKSEANAKASETAAKQSEENTRQNEADLQTAVNAAALSAQNAAASERSARTSAQTARSAETDAAADAQSAKTSATNAAASESGAKTAEQGAQSAEASAKNYSEQAQAVAGNIPYVGENGNWFVGGQDSGVPATGDSGRSIYFAEKAGFVPIDSEASLSSYEVAGGDPQVGDLLVVEIDSFGVWLHQVSRITYLGKSVVCLGCLEPPAIYYYNGTVPDVPSSASAVGLKTNLLQLGDRRLKSGDLAISADGYLLRVTHLPPPTDTEWFGEILCSLNGDPGNVGVTSWNDLTDKPFGETTNTVKEVLAECQPPYDENEGGFILAEGAPTLVIGDTYIVDWNGTEYRCVAQDMSALVLNEIGLGDLSSVGGSGNGEPFMLACMQGMVMAAPLDGSTTLTISIRQETETINTLPVEYMHPSVPYVAEGGMVEVLPETALDMTSEYKPYKLGLVAGETYKVVLNGEEYECAAQGVAEDGVTCVCLGDLYTMTSGQIGTAATGEPFVLIEYPPEMVADAGLEGAFMLVLMDESITSVTLAIYQGGAKINKLDNRCLDLAWLPVYGKEVQIAAEKTCTANSSTPTETTGGFPDLTTADVTGGQTIVVYFDGTRYESKVWSSGEVYYAGNVSILGAGGPDTGEPYLLTIVNSRTIMMFADDAAGSHVMSVWALVANKMPKDFMPDDATELYLTSPSGKKFAITVSDTGALTAAEVTE